MSRVLIVVLRLLTMAQALKYTEYYVLYFTLSQKKEPLNWNDGSLRCIHVYSLAFSCIFIEHMLEVDVAYTDSELTLYVYVCVSTV